MPEAPEVERPTDAPRTAPDHRGSSRRGLLRGLALGGAGAAAVVLAACGDDDPSTDVPPASTSEARADLPGKRPTREDLAIPGRGDAQIVNFALTLEHLEAAFYRQVVDSGVIKERRVLDLVKAFGEQEQEHVDALLKTAKQLGKPPEAPRTNFRAVLEGGPEAILRTAATVENLGAAAYLGQAPRIDDEEILVAAMSIHSVEARHAAALNRVAGLPLVARGGLEGSIPDGPFATPLSMDDVLKRVAQFIA